MQIKYIPVITLCFIVSIFLSLNSSLASGKTEDAIYEQAYDEMKNKWESVKGPVDSTIESIEKFEEAINQWRRATTKAAQEKGIEGIDELFDNFNQSAIDKLFSLGVGEDAVKALRDAEKAVGIKLIDINLLDYAGLLPRQLKDYMYDLSALERKLRKDGVFKQVRNLKGALKKFDGQLKNVKNVMELVRLFDPNHNSDSPAASLQRLASVLQYSQNLADKVPGIGSIIKFYTEACGEFAAALERLDAKLIDARAGALCGQLAGRDKAAMAAFETYSQNCPFFPINAQYPLLETVRGWQNGPAVFLFLDDSRHAMVNSSSFQTLYRYYKALKLSNEKANPEIANHEDFLARAMAIGMKSIDSHDKKFAKYFAIFNKFCFARLLEIAGETKEYGRIFSDNASYSLHGGREEEFKALCFFSASFRHKIEVLAEKYFDKKGYIEGVVRPKNKEAKLFGIQVMVDGQNIATSSHGNEYRFTHIVEKDKDFAVRASAKGFMDFQGKGIIRKTQTDCDRFFFIYLEEEIETDDMVGLVRVLDSGGATVKRANPGERTGMPGSGHVVMQSSGRWVKAYGGWRTEENPPNHPQELGPLNIQPGKYRAHLSYSPDIPASMTAGNWNTGMSVTHVFQGISEKSQGKRVVSLRPGARDKPAGEAFQEFTIDRPGQIHVRFSVAASSGQAGGYAEHAQSYTGKIEFLEPLEQETAEAGTELMPGDILRTGQRDSTVVLSDGTMAVIRARSEMRMEQNAEGITRIVVLRGGGRFITRGKTYSKIEVVSSDGKNLIRPRGTDFIVSDAGVEVIDGEVEILGESQNMIIRAGERYTFRDNKTTDFDIAEAGPLSSSDGIPLEQEYWKPSREPYGEKSAQFRDNVVDGSWLLADPPARWNFHGRQNTPRAGVETPQEGFLRVTIPGNSRLDDQGDTAPRLLHKVTGDFDMEAEVFVEGEGQEWASVQFLVRAPGSYAGSVHGQFPRTLADGPGQHYLLGGVGIARTAGGVMRLPALNDSTQARWPEASDVVPVRIRFVRHNNLLCSFWSLDGKNWNLNSMAIADLPDTLWTGFAFINPARTAAPAIVGLGGLGLRTAPKGMIEMPRWNVFAANGAAGVQGDTVRLALDGEKAGTARAFIGEYQEGDFDVEVAFDAGQWNQQPGEVRRWTLAAVNSNEKGLAVGCEVNDSGQRYGVMHQTREQYDADTTIQHGSGIVEEARGKLRLVRSKDVLSAYYWRGGEWNYFREINYRNQDRGGFHGPMFIRLEVTNGQKSKAFAPMDVTFSLKAFYTSPAERLRKEAIALQIGGDFAGALEKYRESLRFRDDPDLADRVKRLETYVSVTVSEEVRETAVQPGESAEEAGGLLTGQSVRAVMPPGVREHWFIVPIPGPGALSVTAHGYDILRFGLQLLDNEKVLARTSAGSSPENTVSRPDLTAGNYFVRMIRSSGDGPYIIEATYEPQTYASDVEPNDSREKAQEISLGSKTTGLLGYVNAECTDTVDWFKVTTTQPGTLKVNVDTEETLNAHLYLHDVDGARQLARDNSGGKSVRVVEQEGLAPGTYYVQVRRSTGYGGYVIQPRLDAATIPGDREPNDTSQQARNITLNEKSTGLLGYGNMEHRDTVDWFTVTTTQPGTLKVRVEAEETLNAHLYLHDVDGARQLARDNSGRESVRVVEQEGLAPGTYYVQVRRSTGYGGYVIQPRLDAATIPGDREPNDTSQQARNIPLNEKSTGLLGYGNMEYRDTVDWVKVTTIQPGTLTIKVEAEETLNAHLYLHDVDGARQLARDNSGREPVRVVKQEGLAPGTYYIQIRRSTGQGGYSIYPQFVR